MISLIVIKLAKKCSSLLLIFILPMVNCVAQETDYDVIIKHVNQTPISARNSTKELSNYLVSPFNTEIGKFASIYYWVAKNIRYDDELAKNPRLYTDMREIISEVMKSKSGVCQHYAELFCELSRLAGLNAYVVDGYTLENGKIANVSHAWNVINIAGSWSMIDATWANAIIISKTKKGFPFTYFMVDPKESIKTHMPFDPIWQILSNPIKYDDFDVNKFALFDGNFNYKDSINAYLELNSIEQQRETIARMKNNGTFNKLVKKEFLIKEKNLNTSLSNVEIVKFNKGILYYNGGLGYLNQYIKLRNNKFKDKKYGKNAIFALIDSALVNLERAEVNFGSVKILDPEIKKQLKTNTASIAKSKALIYKEREFVKEFFK